MASRTTRTRHPVTGRHVVIWGGSMGIGREAAAEVVRRGGSVSLFARGREALDETAAYAGRFRSRAGQFVDTATCDATDEEAVRAAVDDLVAARGIPDVLVNGVGASDPRYVEDFTVADFRAAMEQNYLGQVTPTVALLPHLLRAGRGHIVNTSSMLGYFAIMGFATYAPTKYAVVGFSEVLRHELRPRGITVGVLFPPDTLTPGYERENLTKPPECLELSAGSKTLSAERVGGDLVDGIESRAWRIMPGDAGFVWRVQRHAPWALRALLDRRYTAARRHTARVTAR
jgi:3-dehydrosphinganine reductase